MRQEIKWVVPPGKSPPISLGRNGCINTLGIEIWYTTDEVFLSPLRSNGETGRCAIALPADATILNEVIRILGNVRDQIAAFSDAK
jgi:hypothetical protein